MGWTAAQDEEEFPDELPLARHARVLPMQHIEADPLDVGAVDAPVSPAARVLPEQLIEADAPTSSDAGLDATSVWDDLLDVARPATPTRESSERLSSAAGRLGRRGARTLEQLVSDPGAAVSGATDSATLGWMDELAGLAGALGSLGQPEGLPGSLPSDPVEAYTATRDMARDYDRAAQERAPSAHAAGEVAGALAPALLTGGGSAEAQAARAPGFLATVGRGAGTGTAVGALAGAGGSDATGSQLVEDTALSALAGGATGGVLASVPAAGRALRARAPAAREAADLARVASVGGGRGTISRESPVVREFARLPGGIAGQAQRIRRLGLAGMLEGPEGVARRTQDVLEQLLANGPMTATRRRLAEEGAEVPVADIARSLADQATGLEGSAVRRPYAQRVRSLIDQFADTYAQPPPAGTAGPADLRSIPYATAIDELGDLSQTVPWGSDTMTADVARGSRAAVRDALDQWVEERLGPEELARYREGRLDYQTALTAAEQARQRASAAAGARGIGLTDVTAATGAKDLQGMLQRLILNRLAGTFGPTGRATGREAIARLLESMPAGTTPMELEALAGRISPDLVQQLRDALGGADAGDEGGGADPFAELGALPDEAATAPTAPTTTTAPTDAAPADDPFAALGAVPDEEEERRP